MMTLVSKIDDPTIENSKCFFLAFSFFNHELFSGVLPPCMITLRGRGKKYGYHHAKRFVSVDGVTIDEIALNAGYLMIQPIEIAMSTLVHEMVHHWQEHFGKPSKSNPHNKEWVRKMEEIGLVPSSTGLPGGRKTGRSISDYIDPNGIFIRACAKLKGNGFSIPWFDRHISSSLDDSINRLGVLEQYGLCQDFEVIPALKHDDKLIGKSSLIEPVPPSLKTRHKYHCTECGLTAWAKLDSQLLCGTCMKALHVNHYQF